MNTRTVKGDKMQYESKEHKFNMSEAQIFDDFHVDIPDYVHISIKQEPLAIKQEQESGTLNDRDDSFVMKNEPISMIKAEPQDHTVTEIDNVPSNIHSSVPIENQFRLKSNDHADWRLGDPLAIFECDICRQLSNTAETLVTHRYTHTQDIAYTCLMCYNAFHIKRDLHKHMLTIHLKADVCKIYAGEDSSSNIPEVQKNSHTGNKPYKCDICHKHFTWKGNLTRHTLIHHTGEEPHRCHICHKQFVDKSSLNTHVRIHTDVKRYECDVCHQRFMRSDTLASHMRTHTGEKRYKCEICLKRFTLKETLIKHRRIHTGEKPYKCSICHKQFSQDSSLSSHTRIHTREKLYECDICRESFTTNDTLTKHKSFHDSEKRYGCEICQKRFGTSSSLAKHKRIHTGEKRYQCDVCHKHFSEKGNLISHVRIHTGEKRYECGICHSRFRENTSLTRHKRIHTRENQNVIIC